MDPKLFEYLPLQGKKTLLLGTKKDIIEYCVKQEALITSLEATNYADALMTVSDYFDLIVVNWPVDELLLARMHNLLNQDGKILVLDGNVRTIDMFVEHGFRCLDTTNLTFRHMEPKTFIVCAYYTENTPYETEISGLRSSLLKLGIPYYFRGYKTLSKWEFNCGIKPSFIRDCMLKFNKRTIMYTDADSVVLQQPEYLESFTHDLAIHYLGGKELLSGTMVIRTNERTLKWIDNWIFEQSLTPNEWDQKTLARVLPADLKIDKLPLEYIQIFDHVNQTERPVVVHNQASRRFKNSVAVNSLDEVFLPDWIDGWRKLGDGSIALLRDDAKAESYLDEHFCRGKGEKRWWPVKKDPKVLPAIKDIHKCEITLIGKGPSLDKLKREHITGPTIALNEAFTITQKLGVQYGTQQDSWMRDACYPHSGILFCSPRAKLHYPGIENAKLLDPRLLGLDAQPLSLLYAYAIAKWMGATSIRLVCFDALVNGNCDYASSVGYKPTNMGNPERFKTFKACLERFDLPYTFFTPE